MKIRCDLGDSYLCNLTSRLLAIQITNTPEQDTARAPIPHHAKQKSSALNLCASARSPRRNAGAGYAGSLARPVRLFINNAEHHHLALGDTPACSPNCLVDALGRKAQIEGKHPTDGKTPEKENHNRALLNQSAVFGTDETQTLTTHCVMECSMLTVPQTHSQRMQQHRWWTRHSWSRA